MTLTVVVVTFNRKKVLRKLLKKLERQSDMDFEVVVAVDGSIDGTQEWLEGYKGRAPFILRWLDTGLTDRYGLAIARNRGIEAAKDGPVVILDDDSFPTEDFITEHKRSIKPHVITGGWIQVNDPYYTGTERMEEYLEVYGDCTPRELTHFKKFRHKNPIENNLCMYRQDWIDVGMFDESIKGYGEISEVFDRLKAKGYRYQFNPRAKVIHHEEYKRSYGRFKKAPHTIPVWLKRIVHPIKIRMKKHAPRFYYALKGIFGSI